MHIFSNFHSKSMHMFPNFHAKSMHIFKICAHFFKFHCKMCMGFCMEIFPAHIFSNLQAKSMQMTVKKNFVTGINWSWAVFCRPVKTQLHHFSKKISNFIHNLILKILPVIYTNFAWKFKKKSADFARKFEKSTPISMPTPRNFCQISMQNLCTFFKFLCKIQKCAGKSVQILDRNLEKCVDFVWKSEKMCADFAWKFGKMQIYQHSSQISMNKSANLILI